MSTSSPISSLKLRELVVLLARVLVEERRKNAQIAERRKLCKEST